MAVHATVTVRRTPSEVFRWIQDPALASQWQVGVLEHEITHQEPGWVGTTFRQVVGDAKGSVQFEGEVTAYVPDTVMEFLVTGRGIRVRSRYEVAPDPVGTRLEVTSDVRIGGPAAPLLSLLTRRRSAKQVRVELARLCALCEA